jgi:hypothetical protein
MADEHVSRIFRLALQTRKLLIPLNRKLSMMSALAAKSGFLPQPCHSFSIANIIAVSMCGLENVSEEIGLNVSDALAQALVGAIWRDTGGVGTKLGNDLGNKFWRD